MQALSTERAVPSARMQVRVDYPAFEGDEEPPELGAPTAAPFVQPLTLIMPHCFDPTEGEESCVVRA